MNYKTQPGSKNIKLTEHAKMRIGERAPHIPKKQYRQWVYNARYKGLSFSQMCPQLQKWVKHSVHLGAHMTGARIYQNYLFVFCGNNQHSRTLVTMYPVPEAIKKLCVSIKSIAG